MDDILLKRIQDVFRLCEKYRSPRFSAFLDGAEQAAVRTSGLMAGTNSGFFGGYPGAERCMLGVFPDWQEPDEGEFPLAALEIKKKYDRELSHRDYLGTVLSLGIERSRVGDILVTKTGAFVFVSEENADFIAENVHKAAGCGVEVCRCELSKIKIPERSFEEIAAVCASERLDAVLAAALKISRSNAKAMLASGKVAVNHIAAANADLSLKEGDLLSVRGFGRMELYKIGGKTRSDRLHVTLKKFI